MASVPVDLITYLDPLVTETAGDDLVEGPAPDPPGDLVAITHYGGEPAEDRVMGPSLTAPGVEVALVQVMVRNALMATAKARADAFHALLDGYDGTINGRRFFNIESLDSMAFSLGQDQSERWRYAFNLRVEHSR